MIISKYLVKAVYSKYQYAGALIVAGGIMLWLILLLWYFSENLKINSFLLLYI
jgi:hypothetical protein